MLLWLVFACLWTLTTTTTDRTLLQVSWTQASDDVTIHEASAVNITVQFGSTTVLHCRVTDRSDQDTVSWLRRQDGQLRLVSVGLEVYTGDQRYAVNLLEPDDWTLSLRNTQETDEGVYECQVSSHPPLVHTLYLRVVVPEMQIWDERGIPIKNKFYNAGSTIELMCSISKVPKPTHFILWKHGDGVLNYDVTRGGISVKTSMTKDGVKSKLSIASVGPIDSGNYTCCLPDVAETTVTVHVLNGETPAAMQHGGSSHQFPATLRLLSILVILYLLQGR